MAVNTPEPEFEQVSVCDFAVILLPADHALTRPPHAPHTQAISEIHKTLEPFLDANPKYKRAWEVMQIPERVIQFR